MDFFSRNIYDEKWSFYLIDPDDNTIADEDAAAETDAEKNEVYFRREGVTLETVRHEIFHVFFKYTFTHSANLDAHQTEEVSAELYSIQGEKMDVISKDVYQELLKLRDGK